MHPLKKGCVNGFLVQGVSLQISFSCLAYSLSEQRCKNFFMYYCVFSCNYIIAYYSNIVKYLLYFPKKAYTIGVIAGVAEW